MLYKIKAQILRLELPKEQVEVFVDSAADLMTCDRIVGMVARCRAPSRVPSRVDHGKKYAYKPIAVLESSFVDVLFMDADVTLLADPLALFDTCEYGRTGALFFPDLFGAACEDMTWARKRAVAGQSGSAGHAMWQLIGDKWKPTWPYAQEFETGLFVVDSRRHYRALKLTQWMTEDATIQSMLFGDKDAFKFGFLAAREPFALAPDPPTQVLRKRMDLGGKKFSRCGEFQRFGSNYIFAHHLPNDLKRLHDWELVLAVPQWNAPFRLGEDREKVAPVNYSYCPPTYNTWELSLLPPLHKLMNVPPSANVDASPTGAELQALAAVQCAESAEERRAAPSPSLRTQDSPSLTTRAGCRTYNGVLATLREADVTSAGGGLIEERESSAPLDAHDDLQL